jgi:protein ImuB
VTGRGAVADTWAAAWGLARYAPGTITPTGAGIAAVAGLPVAALRLEPELMTTLRGLGFDTVGELVAAPRRSLALRFGATLTGRLDAIAGRAHESFTPVLPPSIPHARLVIAEPLGHLRGLEIALERLAAQLCGELEQRSLGARRLDLRFRHVDSQVSALRVGTSRATRDAAHIIRLFRERLQTVDPGSGVEDAVLVASQVEPLQLRQLGTPFTGHETVDLAVLVDRIAGRIGAHRIYRVAPVESDMPERSVTVVPALAPLTGRSWAEGPRPQRLFEPPEPIQVVALLPDHPPALYIWKDRRRHVVAADGPECIAGEWWRDEAEAFLVREYFRIEDEDGLRLWLFRVSGPDGQHWFVHGVFG